MKKIFLLFFATLLISINSFATTPIKKIVYLGDSLSDDGNLYRYFLHVMPKSPPYFDGRFSNGPVWSDLTTKYFSDKYQITALNIATGGANVYYDNPFGGHLPLKLSEERDDYLGRTSFQDRSDTLVIIWIGANDYTGGQTDVEGSTTNVVNEIKKVITDPSDLFKKGLIERGVKNFMLFGLPDLSEAPFAKSSGIQQNLHDLSLRHNEKLIQAIAEIQAQHPDVKIVYFDARFVLDDIIAHTDYYNQKYNKHIKNVVDSCYTGGYTLKASQNAINDLSAELQKNLPANGVDSKEMARYILNSPDLAEAYYTGKSYSIGVAPCDDPEEFLFWDHVHPTAVTHEIMADLVINRILAEKFL